MAAVEIDSTGGWVKFYRVVIEKGWLTNHKLWVFFSYCLLKASHKETVVMVGNQQVALLPGQFIFGRLKCSKELKMSERNVRTCLSTLERLGTVKSTLHPTKQFSLITVVNWGIYQSSDVETDQPTAQAATRLRPQTRSKELKKNKTSSSPSGDGNAIPLFHQQIIEAYRRILPMLPQPRLKNWTAKRRALLNARIKEDREREKLAWWEDLFGDVAQSAHLTGKNDRRWKPDLEWLITSSHFIRTLEGFYHNDQRN